MRCSARRIVSIRRYKLISASRLRLRRLIDLMSAKKKSISGATSGQAKGAAQQSAWCSWTVLSSSVRGNAVFETKTILVTGGTGMIGRYVVDRLIGRGAKVRIA